VRRGAAGRRTRALLTVTFVVALALGASAARADPPKPTVAIMCDEGDSLSRRVRAELDALGFRTVLVQPGDALAGGLEAEARKFAAVGAVRRTARGGVEVWAADRITGKNVRRELYDDSPDRDVTEREAAFALRVVELLRARLLEARPALPDSEVTDATNHLDSSEPPQPAPEPPPAEPPPPAFRMSVEAAALWGRGGFDSAASLELGLAWIPTEHVGLLGFAAIPLSHPQVQDPRGTGTAELTVWLGGGGLRFLFLSRASRLAPTLDLGVAAAVLKVVGANAGPGFVTEASSAAVAAPYLRPGVAYGITNNLRFRADLLVGTTARGASVRFAQQNVASWGQPFVLVSTGLDFGWF
jgi:hypothetical protein